MPLPDLYPLPLTTLVDRMQRELAAGGPLYTLARRDWWVPDPERDTSLVHLGRRIATPAGPASGPHTQLANNLVLAFLAGGRFMELKTVQVNDELVIPRPCIHVPHIGYNVEWSQELRVPQSAAEYAKGWLLVHMLASDHGPGLWSEAATTFDVSVGYDLAGLRSPKVRGYLDTMRDASALLEALRAELPPSLAALTDVDCPSQISDSITISTFHGCPAHEIEAIAAQTLDWGWNTVVKLNPTLLGHDAVRRMLDDMGYGFVQLRPDDFAKDLQWGQLTDFIPRLQARAADKGLGFGVKFTNTLVCDSHEPPFEQSEMYLSGPPLYVLAVTLAERFRAAMGPMPITFSAGVDQSNFHELVAAGIGPVTSCTDLLKGKGYGRMSKYVRGLERAMARAGVSELDGLRGDPEALSRLAASAPADPRYGRAKNAKAPKKVGSHLVLLDCLTCDKCVPVCPNAANFTFPVPPGTHKPGRVRWAHGAFELLEGDELIVDKKHQIGNTADLCNLCGHCDTWCPEDGGPYLVKPTLFLDAGAFADHVGRDGFHLDADGRGLKWRKDGAITAYRERDDGEAELSVEGGSLVLRNDAVEAVEGSGEVDLTVAVTLRLFLKGFREEGPTWVS